MRAGLRRGFRAIRSRVERLDPRFVPPVDDGPLTPVEGAKTTLHVATSPTLEGVTGRYFRELGEARTSPASYDVGTREALWTASAALVGVAVD